MGMKFFYFLKKFSLAMWGKLNILKILYYHALFLFSLTTSTNQPYFILSFTHSLSCLIKIIKKFSSVCDVFIYFYRRRAIYLPVIEEYIGRKKIKKRRRNSIAKCNFHRAPEIEGEGNWYKFRFRQFSTLTPTWKRKDV